MSRSRRKTPIFGWTSAKTEKDDKQIWHRRFRRKVRMALKRGDEVMPHFREVSDPWLMNKDGKYWWGKPRDSDSSWIKRLYRKEMRK